MMSEQQPPTDESESPAEPTTPTTPPEPKSWFTRAADHVQETRREGAATQASYRAHQDRQRAQRRIPVHTLPLPEQIMRYQAAGYHVIAQTDTSAQMLKPKTFNAVIFIIGLLLCGAPGLLYLIVYLAKKDDTAYLTTPVGSP
jgi:hypothetical protein